MSQDSQIVTKGTQIECQKCHVIFTCRADEISSCHCSQISLSKDQLAEIARKWKACLCAACLMEIARKSL